MIPAVVNIRACLRASVSYSKQLVVSPHSPSPIIFGSIIDNTCLLWQEECGETTNCLLYDTDALRQALMLTTAGIMVMGVVCDVAVVYYAKDLKIFDEDNKVKIIQTKMGENMLQLPGNNMVYGSHASLTKDSIFKQ